MGIYIPNVDMPSKKNGAVFVIHPDGTVFYEDGKEYFAVAVPPHRDLIDRDEMVTKLHLKRERCGSGPASAEITKLIHELNTAPAVIRAWEGWT